MPDNKKNGTALPDFGAMADIFAKAMEQPSGRKILIFTDGDVDDTASGIFAHEIPHSGVGKTETVKRIAKQLGQDVVTIDMSQLTSPGDLGKLLGAPPGYQGYEPTPEQKENLAASMAELKELGRLQASRDSGEALAASCHSGVTQQTSCLKPVRFKNENGFITFGMVN
jgi:hypothetical protein